MNRPELVTKSVEATIEPVPDSKATDPNGEFEVILATPGKDRDGDDLQAKGWQLPLPDHITFDTDHGMTVKTLAGSGTPTLERDGSIRVKGSYAGTDHGQTTRQLVNEKHIRTVSVTYLQRTVKSAGKTSVVRELLNGSFVAVPANPKAVVLTSKSLVTDDDRVLTDADVEAIAEATAKNLRDTTYERAASAVNELADAHVELTVVCKGIAGSVEELSDRVRKAVRESHSDQRGYPYVRATFLDEPGKGTVVYDYETYGDSGRGTKTLARSFSDDGKTTTLDATPREVSLVTSVVEHDDEESDTALGKSVRDAINESIGGVVDPLERAVEMLISSGMTREAATKALDSVHTGDNLSASTAGENQAATAVQAAAAEVHTKAAAPLDQRVSALLSELDDAATT